MEGSLNTYKAFIPNSQESELINLIIETSIKNAVTSFVEENANDKARMIGKAVGEIIIVFIGT